MSLNAFLVRLIFLALPGLLATRVYSTLRGRKQQKDWEDLVEIAMFSLLSYGAYDLIVYLGHWMRIWQYSFTAIEAISDEKALLSWREIILSSVIGLALAYFGSFAHSVHLVNRIGRKLRVTKRVADEDVWDHFLSSFGSQNRWVFIRDHKVNLVYYGWIMHFSESERDREIIIKDVDVYDNLSADFLYKVSDIYVARNKDDLTIEVPLSDNKVNKVNVEAGGGND